MALPTQAAGVVVAALLLAGRSMAQRASIFDPPGGPATCIVVHARVDAPGERRAWPGRDRLSPMLLRLDGVAALLLGAEECRRLSAAILPSEGADDGLQYGPEVPGAVRRWVLDCSRPDSAEAGNIRRVEVLQIGDSLVAHERAPDDRPTPLIPLRAERFNNLSASWEPYSGRLEEASDWPAGTVFTVPPPLVAGRVTLDQAALSDRFAGGLPTRLPPASRVLADETFMARLPRGYSPRTPAGLLVWIDPTPSAQPPDVLDAALDELGLICISPGNCGNARAAADRYQLALDAAATARVRWHIDARRVYIAGLSGGAHIACRMTACFPDVFMGTIPIAALSVYDRVQLPAPEIGKFVAPQFRRPSPARFALLRERPFAPVTGPADGNYLSIVGAVEVLKRDGVPVRLFSYDDMGHELPTAARFAEAAQFIDEPWRSARAAEIERAQRLFDAYTARWGDGPAADPAARQALVRVTQAAPWSEPAWRAAALLRPAASLRPSAGTRP